MSFGGGPRAGWVAKSRASGARVVWTVPRLVERGAVVCLPVRCAERLELTVGARASAGAAVCTPRG
eukprot:6940196-Lingulodinium_polyedra.AAC.1